MNWIDNIFTLKATRQFCHHAKETNWKKTFYATVWLDTLSKNYKENSYLIKATAHNSDFYTRTACNTETSANAAFLLSSEDERLAPLLLEK